MSSELDKLIAESEAAIKRLDALEAKRPLLDRVRAHFRRNSNSLINVLLAGSVFAVALGRLMQKQEHETQRENWERQQRILAAEKEEVEQHAAVLLSSTETLVSELEAAARGKAQRDLPHFVLQQLADWRQAAEARQQQQQLGLPAAAAAAIAGESESNDGDDSGSSKIMI